MYKSRYKCVLLVYNVQLNLYLTAIFDQLISPLAICSYEILKGFSKSNIF